ncbi:MAG TPA: hypothetical protein VFP00_04720 [Burkholderiales bacterium]|nr:hypothetical protein [Burkholderiales bacterium]
MKDWHKKLALILLLLMPLQSLATSLTALTCYSGDAHHQTQTHEHGAAHGHDDGSSRTHEGETGTDRSGHLNCHHVFSGVPMTLAASAPSELPAFESSISLLHTLFVPERPQRPPRS